MQEQFSQVHVGLQVPSQQHLPPSLQWQQQSQPAGAVAVTVFGVHGHLSLKGQQPSVAKLRATPRASGVKNRIGISFVKSPTGVICRVS